MTATIQDIMTDIYAIEALIALSFTTSGGETYTVTAGDLVSIPFFPPPSQSITDNYSVLHRVQPSDVKFMTGGWKYQDWTVHCRLLVRDADYADQIAVSLAEPMIEAFAQYIKFNQRSGWQLNGIRFNGEQPIIYRDSGGNDFYGLDYFLDLQEHKTITVAAGSLS